MARKKKRYSRAERARLRDKAEKEKKLQGAALGLRTSPVRPPRVEVTGRLRCRSRDIDHVISRFHEMEEDHAERFRLYLETALRRRPGLLDEPFRTGLYHLAMHEPLRKAGRWRPLGRGLAAWFRSFASHVHGRFPICPFLWDSLLIFENLFQGDFPQHHFVIRLSRGNRPRDLLASCELPLDLTRRMIHLMIHPPGPMSLRKAMLRSVVLAQGGSEHLAHSLAKTNVIHLGRTNDERGAIIKWLCRQKGVDHEALDDLVFYLQDRYAENPDFTLKGRTFARIKRDSDRYWSGHTDRREERLARRGIPRAPTPVPDFVPLPQVPIDNYEGPHGWTIERIRTARQLVMEGALMRHCIGTYRPHQKSGDSTYWSMRQNGKRKITIEVDMEEMAVECAAGKANRDPRPAEILHLESWVRENGLTIEEFAL